MRSYNLMFFAFAIHMFHGLVIENCIATDRKIMMIFNKMHIHTDVVGLKANKTYLSTSFSQLFLLEIFRSFSPHMQYASCMFSTQSQTADRQPFLIA